MLSILLTKLPTSEMLKKVTLEAHRFSGKEALAAGFVDVLGKDGEDVLEKAKAIAKKVSGKAEAGVWGLIKVCFRCLANSCRLSKDLTGCAFSFIFFPSYLTPSGRTVFRYRSNPHEPRSGT